MDNIYFPSHKDAGNRGCEAITEGTVKILKNKEYNLVAFSSDIELDSRMGLHDIIEIQPVERITDRKNAAAFLFKIKRKLQRRSGKKAEYVYKDEYDKILKGIKRGDIVFSTGGDMLCYGNNEIIYINNYLNKRKIKTVLWGCSVGMENLTPEKIETLNRFSVITVRESMTQDVMQKIGLKNVYLYPDPAFVLEPETCDLPDCFSKREVIGINLSNFVGEDVGFDTVFGKNIVNLFDYILSNTELQLLLIPHVFWKGQDDRLICNDVYNRYKQTGRVSLLDAAELNYCQIRYIISKCRFFIGARTHAMISAYSTGVPALALGYSIKSRGIAKDLGFGDSLVADCKNLKTDTQLVQAFETLLYSEEEIKKIYEDSLSDYISRAYNAKEVLGLLEE